MSSQATGLATIEVSFPQENLVRVLVIDDEESFLSAMQDFFSSNNYSIELARTPEEAAQLLKKSEFELVIADINFGDLSDVKGDHFMMKNARLFGSAKRVVVTGQWLDEKRYKVLEKAGIVFLGKEDELSKRLEEVAQELVEVAQEKAEARTKSIMHIVKRAAQQELAGGAEVEVKLAAVAPATPSPADLLKNELKQMLIKWLDARKSRDEQVLAYGQNFYSANDMIEQIKDETEVGLDHLRLLVSEIKFSLGLEQDDSQHYAEPDDGR